MFDEYPEVTPEFLSKWKPEDPETNYVVDRVLFPKSHKRAMVTSFFCSFNACMFPNQYPPPIRDIGSPWWVRYVEKLCESLRWFETYYFFKDWKVRIYIDPTLIDIVDVLVKQSTRVEFYVMTKPSVGHNPGASWRFLAMEDSSLDLGCVFDCDEHMQYVLPSVDAFVKNPVMGVGRLMPQGIAEIQDHGQRIHTPISAHMVCFRPSVFKLPIRNLLLQFIAYRKSVAITDKPWQYPGVSEETPYTKSYGLPHIFGWGNHWYIYGFDERFLKHVIYPYAVRNGLLQSWLFQPIEMFTIPELHNDIVYVQSNPSNDLCLLYAK
jgi:hypothetical protein